MTDLKQSISPSEVIKPSLNWIIFGSDESYFTMKLVTALVWSRLPFKYVHKGATEVKDLLEKRSGTHKIPVLKTPEGWIIDDTSPLLDYLDSYSPYNTPLFYPPGLVGALSRIFEDYFDEWTTRLAVHYRWHYEEDSAYNRKKMGEHFSSNPETQQMFGETINKWGLRSCRALGIDSATQRLKGEQELFRVLKKLDEYLEREKQKNKNSARKSFVFGPAPTSVDAVIFGALRAHFFHDPTPRKHLGSLKNVWDWYHDNYNIPVQPIANYKYTPNHFTEFLLHEMSESWKTFLTENQKALSENQKAFTATIYGEPVSYLTRAYPEHSRQLVVMKNFYKLDSSERAQLDIVLKKADLHELYGFSSFFPTPSKL